ncbi:MAG: electron transfer flavoprotein-ubiquinone oxidoreductase, partial [Legionella sp. 21-45-4]
GWPLNKATFGGSFIYHLPNQQLAIGLVVGLDYSNPWLDPFEEMQRFKTHPMIKPYFNNAERLEFGARALNEGGWQSQPHLTFPGGALIGDAAGFLNVSQIKGIHTAIESGMLAADACVEMLNQSNAYGQEAFSYTTKIKSSWVESELFRARNIRPGFRYGLAVGLCNAAFETYVSRGYSPWTLPHRCDHATLRPAHQSMPISYPKPDGVITFDRASSVYLSNTHHHENQPNHLYLNDETVPIHLNYAKYASPETRYCPAGVYEIVGDEQHKKLQINASNCIHCKTCDIKDPTQNIIWHVPEGGGGPNYRGL